MREIIAPQEVTLLRARLQASGLSVLEVASRLRLESFRLSRELRGQDKMTVYRGKKLTKLLAEIEAKNAPPL